jgi:hypothetical protein
MRFLKPIFMAFAFLTPGSNQIIQAALVTNLTKVNFTSCDQLNGTNWCYDNNNISVCTEEEACCFSNGTLYNRTPCILDAPPSSNSLLNSLIYTEATLISVGLAMSILVCCAQAGSRYSCGVILFFFGSGIFGGVGTGLGYLTKSKAGMIALTTFGMFAGSFLCLVPCEPPRERARVAPLPALAALRST